MTSITCLVPAWEFPAAPVRLSLYFGNESSEIVFEPDTASLATFYASWSNISGSPVEAGHGLTSGQTLVFSGGGFDAALALSCVFSSRLVPYSAVSCAKVVNRTTVTCTAPPFLAASETAVVHA